MSPRFGTSGLRGLVSDLTPQVVSAHVRAFVAACATGHAVYVGQDLRASSPRISDNVIAALLAAGVDVADCGAVPTPALAMAAMAAGCGAVMVTGSHIPDDRNGLKFYTPGGELTKAGEASILAALHDTHRSGPPGTLRREEGVQAAYAARYLTGVGAAALAGLRLGHYAHSAVGHDGLASLLRALGAEVVTFGQSDRFVPVDTEAVDEATRAMLRHEARRHGFDAILATDGDGDRPLMTDQTGEIVPGDRLGQIAARVLGARTVVTPVTSNGGAEAGGHFETVIRTRIGSPYVIAAMAAAGGRVAGYEANGGFVLGFDAGGPAAPILALWTRDAVLPMIAILHAACSIGGVAALVAAEPARFTTTDRLQEVTPALSAKLLQGLERDGTARDSLLASIDTGAAVLRVDRLDGWRMMLDDGSVVHLRASGNAPELRVYVETASDALSRTLLAKTIRAVELALATLDHAP